MLRLYSLGNDLSNPQPHYHPKKIKIVLIKPEEWQEVEFQKGQHMCSKFKHETKNDNNKKLTQKKKNDSNKKKGVFLCFRESCAAIL